jgi:hypothetical protein
MQGVYTSGRESRSDENHFHSSNEYHHTGGSLSLPTSSGNFFNGDYAPSAVNRPGTICVDRTLANQSACQLR